MTLPKLTRKLVLEAPQRLADGAGGFDVTWTPIGIHWAELRYRPGRERAGQDAPMSVQGARVIVRGAPQGDPARPEADQRFREGNRLFRILAVREHDPHGHYLEALVEEEIVA